MLLAVPPDCGPCLVIPPYAEEPHTVLVYEQVCVLGGSAVEVFMLSSECALAVKCVGASNTIRIQREAKGSVKWF